MQQISIKYNIYVLFKVGLFGMTRSAKLVSKQGMEDIRRSLLLPLPLALGQNLTPFWMQKAAISEKGVQIETTATLQRDSGANVWLQHQQRQAVSVTAGRDLKRHWAKTWAVT